MPKSSSAMLTPSARNASSRACASCGLSIRIPSVTSSTTREDAMPVSAMTAPTRSTIQRSRICSGERLTATDRFGHRARIGERAAQHDLAELGHQAGLLRERNEDRRRDGAAARMGPAQQRFDADDGAAVGRDHRLIVDFEFLQRDRGLQFAQQEAPLGVFDFDLRLEETASGRGPSCLAARSARPARRASSSPVVPSSGARATPMPAVICHIRSTKIGRCSDARSEDASAVAARRSSLLTMTANSSSSKRPNTAPAGKPA